MVAIPFYIISRLPKLGQRGSTLPKPLNNNVCFRSRHLVERLYSKNNIINLF